MIDTEVLRLEIKQYISDSNLKTFVPRIVGQTSNLIIFSEIINKFKDSGWSVY